MDRTVPTDSDYYVLLGVPPVASFDEIKEAYRRQALKFHPDKNRDVNATEQFQRLARAWEILKDEGRRREYDSRFARRTRDEIDREVRAQWQAARQHRSSVLEIARIERAREWKSEIKKEYLSRLQAWKEFRERQLVAIKHYQVLVGRYENQLDDQMKESKETLLEKFSAAISLSEATGQYIEDHGDVVSRLMEARRIYLLNLSLACQATRGRLQHLLEELAEGRSSFEDEEYRNRQLCARRALEILDSDESRTPIFSIIDRKHQSINYWKTLKRVSRVPSVFTPMDSSESPWHEGGRWNRVTGEHSCGRCSRSAFHVIPECGAARCPRCGMVICNDCHRDLVLLREFEAWLCSDVELEDSLFSLEFEEGSSPIASWDGAGVSHCWV